MAGGSKGTIREDLFRKARDPHEALASLWIIRLARFIGSSDLAQEKSISYYP